LLFIVFKFRQNWAGNKKMIDGREIGKGRSGAAQDYSQKLWANFLKQFT